MTRDTAVERLIAVGVEIDTLVQLIAAIRIGTRFYVRRASARSDSRGRVMLEGLTTGEELAECNAATAAALHTWANESAIRYTRAALIVVENAARDAGGLRVLAECIDHISKRPSKDVVAFMVWKEGE